MVNWHRFSPSNFEYDFDQDKLAAHRVAFSEAVECFFSDFEVAETSGIGTVNQLIGTTAGGRKLKVIFQLKLKNIVRIITGWPI